MAKIQAGLGGGGTDMGLASNVLGTFAGPVTGLLGLGGNVLSWILGSDKFDWNKWKKDQYADINRNYDTSLSKATEQANKTAQSTIGEATNKQVMAGGVAGINNPGRLEAQTYANIAQNRDNAVTSITNGLEQNRASMLSAVSRQAAEGSMTEDFNAPTTLDYMNNFMKTLQTTPGQEGVGLLFGAPLAGIKSLLGGGKTINPSTTQTQSTNNNQSTVFNQNSVNNMSNPSIDTWVPPNPIQDYPNKFSGFNQSGEGQFLQNPSLNLKNLNSSPFTFDPLNPFKRKKGLMF